MMGGKSSTGAGLKVQRPLTFLKAQFPHSASTVFRMRFICLSTDYDVVLCKGCYTIDLVFLYCSLLYYLLVVTIDLMFLNCGCRTSRWLYYDFSNSENPDDHCKHMKDTVIYIYECAYISN